MRWLIGGQQFINYNNLYSLGHKEMAVEESKYEVRDSPQI